MDSNKQKSQNQLDNTPLLEETSSPFSYPRLDNSPQLASFKDQSYQQYQYNQQYQSGMSGNDDYQEHQYANRNDDSIEYHFVQNLPAEEKLEVKTNTIDLSKFGIICSIIMNIYKIILIGFLLVAIFGSLPATLKSFTCEDKTDYKGYCIFFNLNRVIATFIFTPIMFYVISNASTSSIVFTDSTELKKWDVVARYFDFTGFFGLFYVMTFFFLASYSTFLSPIDDKITAFDFPALFTSTGGAYLLLVIILLYFLFSLCSCCDKEKKCMRFNDFDRTETRRNKDPLFKAFVNLDVLNVEDEKCNHFANYALGFGFLIALGFAIAFLIHFNKKGKINVDGPKDAIKFILLVISLVKYPFIMIMFIKYSKKVHELVIFKFLFVYFELGFLLEIADFDDDTVKFAITYFVIVGVLLFFVIIQMAINGQIKTFLFDKIAYPIKNIFWDEKWIKILSICICLGTAIPFYIAISNALDLYKTGETVNSGILWANDVSDEAKKYLTIFNPNESMVRYANIIMQALNFEGIIFFVIIAVVVLFGFRTSGDQSHFTFIWDCILLYQLLCILRIDGITDTIIEDGNVGYANLAHGDFYKSVYKNYHSLFVSVWLLVTIFETNHSMNNIEVSKMGYSEIGQGTRESNETIFKETVTDNRLKSKCLSYISKSLLTVILTVPFFYFFFYAVSKDWISVRAKDFTYMDTSVDPSADIISSVIETPITPSSEFNEFLNNLKDMTTTIDDFQENGANKELFDAINYEPLIGFDKAGFIIPPIFAVAFIFYGTCLNLGVNKMIVLCIIHIVANFNNFLVLLSFYFLMFVRAEQVPYYFIEVISLDGIFSAMLLMGYSIFLLAIRTIDILVPLGFPMS